MRTPIPFDFAQAEAHHPKNKLDGSGVGINYADALIKPVKLTLEDGRKVAFKRRGLKITATIGEKTGEAILRRLEHGPSITAIVRAALSAAVADAEGTLHFAEDAAELEA
jgi:hypothetical protein